ncbi:hypothetical protein DBY65_017330 [Pseudomonas sp. RIT412]|nr:hypothetical protein DBP26_010520 [Pseudomonas sp. RIT 409]RAU52397.1 hypothetical protein DBY65_017330 [Pseudomonas sp. RIT 412]
MLKAGTPQGGAGLVVSVDASQAIPRLHSTQTLTLGIARLNLVIAQGQTKDQRRSLTPDIA